MKNLPCSCGGRHKLDKWKVYVTCVNKLGWFANGRCVKCGVAFDDTENAKSSWEELDKYIHAGWQTYTDRLNSLKEMIAKTKPYTTYHTLLTMDIEEAEAYIAQARKVVGI